MTLRLKATPGPTTYFLRLLRAVYESDPRAERDARRGLRVHGIRVTIDRTRRKGAHAGPRTRRPDAPTPCYNRRCSKCKTGEPATTPARPSVNRLPGCS